MLLRLPGIEKEKVEAESTVPTPDTSCLSEFTSAQQSLFQSVFYSAQSTFYQEVLPSTVLPPEAPPSTVKILDQSDQLSFLALLHTLHLSETDYLPQIPGPHFSAQSSSTSSDADLDHSSSTIPQGEDMEPLPILGISQSYFLPEQGQSLEEQISSPLMVQRHSKQISTPGPGLLPNHAT